METFRWKTYSKGRKRVQSRKQNGSVLNIDCGPVTVLPSPWPLYNNTGSFYFLTVRILGQQFCIFHKRCSGFFASLKKTPIAFNGEYTKPFHVIYHDRCFILFFLSKRGAINAFSRKELTISDVFFSRIF